MGHCNSKKWHSSADRVEYGYELSSVGYINILNWQMKTAAKNTMFIIQII